MAFIRELNLPGNKQWFGMYGLSMEIIYVMDHQNINVYGDGVENAVIDQLRL
jgi:hypothetical protein